MRFREQRFPSDDELRVMYGDEVRRVQLVNISTIGARLEQLGHLPQDALVMLCHLHVRIPTRVVWSNDRQTGVRFVAPLSTTDMNALRRAGDRKPRQLGIREPLRASEAWLITGPSAGL